MPRLLATFIDLELNLSRRFREDTLSDLVIASFLQLPGVPVAVLTPNESRTGSDFDLEIVDLNARTTFAYRIQAKRLGYPTINPAFRSYPYLDHRVKGVLQSDILCDPKNLSGPVPIVPIYAFFNNASVSQAIGVPDIGLVDGFYINKIIHRSITTTPKPLFKRISSIQHLFFEFKDLLCPPQAGSGSGLATPEESRDSFDAVRRRESARGLDDWERPIPQLGEATQEQIRALREREFLPIRPSTTKSHRPRVLLGVYA